MKKILLSILLCFILVPFSVNAEECTDEMVSSYLSQANSVYIQYEATTNPDTYKIYVYGVSTGISYDGINGTRYSDGYYAFASAGDTFSINIKVSDGSICALRSIKTLSISLPSNTTVTQPVVEETPVTSNENDETNNTTTSSDSSSGGTASSNDSNSDTSSQTIDDQLTTEEKSNSSSEGDLSEETGEDLITTTSEDVKENNNNNNNKIIIISILTISILCLVSVGIYIYMKKFRRHKN